ncbi:lysine--tRNA ligase, partial [Candidatus Saccharibacteria bacterium]|nr:lysine--tRNA ligase [Candidatus Saccharibacteria bacterium]
MLWLTKIVDEIETRYPTGELLVSSGVSPSGKYHIGTLREVLTADAVLIILRKRGRKVRHIHFVDDLDGLRKVPAGVPEEFSKYLGKPVCDVPSPEAGADSYADFYLNDFIRNVGVLGIDMEVVRSHQQYRQGFFVRSIEKSLDEIDAIKKCLEEVSGRALNDDWSPIQVNIDGYLKKRPFISIDKSKKTITYVDQSKGEQTISYQYGDVKLDWRIDWPARWWQLDVIAEPFGRDHATKGGSYDTGKAIIERVFGGNAPIPVPYQFINRSGETKKMSKSAGNTVTISELLEVLPAEIVRYFVLRFAPDKQLFFSQTDGLIRLIDDYAELLTKTDKTKDEELLLYIVNNTINENTVSNVPFSHLVASYQAALRDASKTIDIIKRTEYATIVSSQESVIIKELNYIDKWLDKWAPDDVKFSRVMTLDTVSSMSNVQKDFLKALGDKILKAPEDADGNWFHQAIYQLRETGQLSPKDLFSTLYQALIGKDSGPRAGWFLSIL